MRNSIKFTTYSDGNEVIYELFESFRSRYQGNLETSMRGRDFISDSVHLMHYKCHKVNSIRGGLYTDSPDRIKKKKALIKPKNTDHKCFQYAATVALNYKKIK